jgi:hypothetical protein
MADVSHQGAVKQCGLRRCRERRVVGAGGDTDKICKSSCMIHMTWGCSISATDRRIGISQTQHVDIILLSRAVPSGLSVSRLGVILLLLFLAVCSCARAATLVCCLF